MISRNSKKLRRKPLIIAGVLIVALGGASALWIAQREAAPATPAGVKLAPATKEEKKESDDNKDRIIAEQKNGQTQPAASSGTVPQPAGSKKQVSVIITYAGSDSVNAYVTGVFEEGGVCTATFSQGSSTVTRTSSGFKNASYTQCAPITPSLPNAGSWSVTVSYSSATAEGTSKAQTF